MHVGKVAGFCERLRIVAYFPEIQKGGDKPDSNLCKAAQHVEHSLHANSPFDYVIFGFACHQN